MVCCDADFECYNSSGTVVFFVPGCPVVVAILENMLLLLH